MLSTSEEFIEFSPLGPNSKMYILQVQGQMSVTSPHVRESLQYVYVLGRLQARTLTQPVPIRTVPARRLRGRPIHTHAAEPVSNYDGLKQLAM